MIVEGILEVDNNPQSQIQPIFQYFLQTHAKEDIALTADAEKDDETIEVAAGHGITVGDSLIIREGDIFEQTIVTAVATNTISIEMPLQQGFSTDSLIIRGSRNMAVDGATTQTTFLYDPSTSETTSPIIPVDISYLVITMRHSTEGDDSKFGSLTALTKGMYIRKVNGETTNLGNYKLNQDFVDRGWEYISRSKSGGGEFSTTLKLDFNQIFTVESRFNPRLLDKLLCIIRDDLSGLISFTFSILGSFTERE